jgi:hypothetical protein
MTEELGWNVIRTVPQSKLFRRANGPKTQSVSETACTKMLSSVSLALDLLPPTEALEAGMSA